MRSSRFAFFSLRSRFKSCVDLDSGALLVEKQFLSYRSVFDPFKRIVKRIGYPKTRFHDLRHSYAIASIKGGDNIKTVQENLGHATAAFTLDVYGHVTAQMKRESADRMEQFIKSVSAG